MTAAAPHIPVLLKPVLEVLAPQAEETIVDGTFGAGGYSRAILAAAECKVIGVDRDLSVQVFAKELPSARFQLLHGTFGDVQALLAANDLGQVDGFVLDIGVSSMQLDEAERGFSFRYDAPLDMRMNREAGQTAADLVNTLDEKELADVIYLYGEERKSRRIAAAIVRARTQDKIERTGQLADIIRGVLPKTGKIDPATRTFQALRIAVNDELGELSRALEASLHILKPGGRLVVVTFHSLEDRIVKNFLRDYTGGQTGEGGSRYLPENKAANQNKPAAFQLLTKKAIEADEAEIALNPRARSARLRAAIRLGEAA